MKKRIIYSILIIFLLMTTIVQSLGAVLATSSIQDGNDDSVKTSKIVDNNKAITQVSDSQKLLSGSQSVAQSTSEQQPTKTSGSKKSTEKKSAAKKQVKSVMIQPKAIGEKYPDFSKSLIGQSGVTAVDPTNTTEEIAYPNNAFPNFIPGVSSQTINGLTMDNYGTIDGSQLDDTENHNIYYSKVMSYVDSNSKHHWIDIKESFIALDKRGWNFGRSDFTPTNSFSWDFTTGLGNKTTTKMPGMLSISKTLGTQGIKISYPAKGTYASGTAVTESPHDVYDFNQPVKVKLDFIDNTTKQPINISGFLTLGDMDHRDYIEFAKSDNLSKVYVTNDSSLKGTTTDPSLTRIVNGLGNWDYGARYAPALHGDYDTNGNSVQSDPIKPDNTRAWTTVVFNDTNTLDYTINDTGQLDFLATALVPVAFSAPAKDGDGDEYNSKWDDQSIRFNMVATLPYRGSTIHNPQRPDVDTSAGSTISTFKQATEFKLSDPVDNNLTVTAVKVLDQTGADVSSKFDVTTADNQVVASAKDTFLADETNYAQPYTLEIDTTVKSEADLSSYNQVKAANGNTYAEIPNTGHMAVIKKAGATEEKFDSNEANGHVKIPDPVREVQDMKQEIKNYDTAGEDWQPIVDDASTTTGYVGDKIGYRFSFKAKDSNTASITDASITSISDNAAVSAPVNAKVTVGSTTTDGKIVYDSTTKRYSIKIETPIKKGQAVTVTIERTANKTGTYFQYATLNADSLTAKPDGNDEATDGNGYSFNLAALTIKAAPYGKITIRYVDLDQDLSQPDVAVPTTPADPAGSKIAESVTVTGKIGTKVSEGMYADKTPVAATDRLTPKVIADYTITSVTETDPLSINSGWEAAYKDDPVFDSGKNRIITYGYKKRMISIQAPSEWNLGIHKRTMEDKTYYFDAKEEPQKVTVSDYYGVSNWSLNVRQERQFEDVNHHELTGAELRFKNGTSVKEANTRPVTESKGGMEDVLAQFELNPSDGVGKNLMKFVRKGTYQKEPIEDDHSSSTDPYTDAGYSIWSYKLGDELTADTSIGLHVPDTTPREAALYTTTLDWSLTVGP